MDSKNPVLEWRVAVATKKLMDSVGALCQAMPDGDQMTMAQTQTWIRSTAAMALVVDGATKDDLDERERRALDLIIGAWGCLDGLPADRKARFVAKALRVMMHP